MGNLENKIFQTIDDLNTTRSSTLAEFIAAVFKDQFIELYLGDAYEEVKFEQHQTAYAATFCGKVLGAYKECLIICAAYVDGKDIKLGKVMFISERAIRTLSPVDGKSSLQDMFLRGKDTLDILKRFG